MAFGGKTLNIFIGADISKLKSSLNSANRELEGFGGKLDRLVGPALLGASAAAGAFAVSAGIDGVKSAISLGESVNKASVIFGKASDEIISFSENANTSLGQTQQQAIDAASTFATFGKSAGLSGQALSSFATELVTLSADFASFNNTSPEEAINAIGAALRGEAEPLRRFGVLLDDATLRGRAMEMGIYNGSGALTAQQKVLAAHQEILSQSTDAQGDFARTSDSLANQAKILSASFDDLKTSFGTGFIDGLGATSDGIDGVTQSMQDAKNEFKFTGQVGGASVGLLARTWNYLYDNFQQNNPIIENTARLINLLTGGVETSTNAVISNAEALATWRAVADPFMRGGYSGIPVAKSVMTGANWLAKIKAMKEPLDNVRRGQSGVGSAVDAVNPKLQKQIDLVQGLTDQLGDAAKRVNDARKEMNDWQASMAANITSGIDLGAAFEQQFEVDNAGKKIGVGLLEGFQKQIDQAGLFGTYLQQLNSEGGPELRDAVAALGPEAGNKLAKQMIDEGLVKTFQEKLVTVKSTARTAADAMTPEFLVAGVNSAVNFLIGTQNTLAAATNELEAMGEAMGKTIGDAAAKAIVDAVNKAREALGQGQATLAGASTPATLANGLPSAYAGYNFSGGMGLIGPTTIAQAIARAISDSDARLGRTGQAVLQ